MKRFKTCNHGLRQDRITLGRRIQQQSIKQNNICYIVYQ